VVRLVCAKGLVIPSDHRAISLFAKARLVDANGHSRTTDFVEDFTFQSPTVGVSPNPSFKDHKFSLRCADRYDQQEFFRIELFLDYVAARASLGAIYIPLSYFDMQEETYTFPVTKHTRSQHGIVPVSSSFSGSTASASSSITPSLNAADLLNFSLASVRSQLADLGCVTIRCHRAEKPEKHRNAVLDIAGSVRSASVFDDIYLAECVPAAAGNSALDSLQIETVSVAALPDGLKVLEMEKEVSFMGRDTTVSSVSGRDLSFHLGDSSDNLNAHKGGNSDKQKTVEIEIEVFENQRRTPYPPFDWSSSAITRPHFSNLDYSIGFGFEKIEDAQPPEGFVWSSDWSIDMEPLGPKSAGRDGWMYSFTFGKLLENYKKRWSHTDPFNTHARRRRFVRKAMSKPSDTTLLLMTNRDALVAFQVTNSSQRLSQPKQTSVGSSTVGLMGAATSIISSGSQHGSGQVVSGKELIEDWRKSRAEAGALLGSCEEKINENSAIMISWDQVLFADVVSSAVLLIGVRIHRCLGSSVRGFTFRPSEVHLFVSNCPAHEFKSLVDERKLLLKTRQNLRRLISSGDVFGGECRDSTTRGIDAGEAMDDAVPETEELSLGSEIAADLDSQITQMQSFVRKLERQRRQLQSVATSSSSNSPLFSSEKSESMRKSHDEQQNLILRSESLRKEIDILNRRLCRLRLYLAALYGMGLTGAHSFDEESVRAIVDKDLQRVQNIVMEDAVSTANNRIEFLLDVAEKRIRDVALCGWKQPTMLHRCAELFANCYLTEIINVLGAFFEDQQLMEIKGMGGKIELIRTYMKHNDRLDHILESAFRPYRLHAEPPALLSMCLDFDQLIGWYATSLSGEMRVRVDSVFQLWRTQSRQDSNVANQFCNDVELLPWYPSMSEGTRTFFYTGMPVELQAVLVQYLAVARIRRDQVAVSYKSAIFRLDGKVCLAFSNAFLYLAETYQREVNQMKHRPWHHAAVASLTREGEAEERLTWLASVANDLHRSVQRRVFEVDQAIRDEVDSETLLIPELQSLSLSCLCSLCTAEEVTLEYTSNIMLSLFLKHSDWESNGLFVRLHDEMLRSEEHQIFSDMLQQYQQQIFNEFEQFFEVEVTKSLWYNVALQIVAIFFFMVHQSWRHLPQAGPSSERNKSICVAIGREARNLSVALTQSLGSFNDYSFPKLLLDQPVESQRQFCPTMRKFKLLDEVILLLPLLADLLEDDLQLHVDQVDFHLQHLRDVMESSVTELEYSSIAVLLERVLGLQGLRHYLPRTSSPKPIADNNSPPKPHVSTPHTPIPPASPVPVIAHAEKRRSIFGNISDTLKSIHLPTSFSSPEAVAHSHHGPSLDLSQVGDDPLLEEDLDENSMKMRLQAQKEQAIVACMEMHLSALRIESKISKAGTLVDLWHLKDPIDRASHAGSLASLLLNDADIGLFWKKSHGSVLSASKEDGGQPMFSFTRLLNGLKGSSQENAVLRKSRSLHNIHYAHLADTSQMLLILGDMQVTNLFFVASNFSLGLMQATPRPYLRVTVMGGDRVVADTHTDILDNEGIARGCGIVDMSTLEARWSEEMSVAIQDASVSQLDVTIRLCYAVTNYQDDHILGFVRFSFSPFDYPSTFVRRLMVLDTSEVSSNGVRSAVKQVLLENRNLPMVAFSYKCTKKY
jgi:hypothetical protein